MINLYELHKNPKKLEKYKNYGYLITSLIDEDYNINFNYGPILHIIKKAPEQAYWYTRLMMHGRWEEAERYILKDIYFAFCYAENIIKGRWIELEPIIITDGRYAFHYAKDVIKERWIDSESYITGYRNDFYWKEYCRIFNL